MAIRKCIVIVFLFFIGCSNERLLFKELMQVSPDTVPIYFYYIADNNSKDVTIELNGEIIHTLKNHYYVPVLATIGENTIVIVYGQFRRVDTLRIHTINNAKYFIKVYFTSVTIVPENKGLKEIAQCELDIGPDQPPLKIISADLVGYYNSYFAKTRDYSYLVKAAVVLDLQNDSTATGSIKKIIIDSLKSESSIKTMINLQRERKNVTEISKLYDRLYKLKPEALKLDAIEHFLGLAKIYYSEQKDDSAIYCYKKVIAYGAGSSSIEFQLAKSCYRKEYYSQSKEIALKLIDENRKRLENDPTEIDDYINNGLCFLLAHDLVGAEGEFQKHASRADEGGKRRAQEKLLEFLRENVNMPDATSILNRFYPSPPVGNYRVAADSSKVKILNEMILDSFSKFSKVNIEPDKAYLLIHSQITGLRFDSNRKISQVNELSQGEWEIWLPAGTHILKIDANGYQRLELPPMNFAKKQSYQLIIKAAPSE